MASSRFGTRHLLVAVPVLTLSSKSSMEPRSLLQSACSKFLFASVSCAFLFEGFRLQKNLVPLPFKVRMPPPVDCTRWCGGRSPPPGGTTTTARRRWWACEGWCTTSPPSSTRTRAEGCTSPPASAPTRALFERMHLDAEAAGRRCARSPAAGRTRRRRSGATTTPSGAYRAVRERVRARCCPRARAPTRGAERRAALWACAAACANAWVLLLPCPWFASSPSSAPSPPSLLLLLACAAAGLCNAVLGGFGHSFLHRPDDPRALLLDWNGLSAFEWMLEHVVSHHPARTPRTTTDLDGAVRGLLRRRRATSRCTPCSWWASWSSRRRVRRAPLPVEGADATAGAGWVRLASLVFPARAAAHVAAQGRAAGALTRRRRARSARALALAHLSHAPPRRAEEGDGGDFLSHQLSCTRDVRAPRAVARLLPAPLVGDLLLGLDRQTLHHLFPSVDHSRLDAALREVVRAQVRSEEEARGTRLHASSLTPLPPLALLRLMHRRLFGG